MALKIQLYRNMKEQILSTIHLDQLWCCPSIMSYHCCWSLHSSYYCITIKAASSLGRYLLTGLIIRQLLGIDSREKIKQSSHDKPLGWSTRLPTNPKPVTPARSQRNTQACYVLIGLMNCLVLSVATDMFIVNAWLSICIVFEISNWEG